MRHRVTDQQHTASRRTRAGIVPLHHAHCRQAAPTMIRKIRGMTLAGRGGAAATEYQQVGRTNSRSGVGGLRSRERCRRDTQASTLCRSALTRRERTTLKHAEFARRVQRAWPEARSAS